MLTISLDPIERFCAGDVVTTKAGGPRMTVEHVGTSRTDGDWAVCQWFDERGDFRQEKFPSDALVREPRSISPGRVHFRGTTAGDWLA
ncbi:DUF2158 domain-containing protein [Trinickia fusca]|uniref:DUF2158 domain-containing protein n=2 Tax=Trinickia fusca TaxID=2419777 RepID=A0A494X6D8_9BURK|nr:YodC family protein [Trinickia fusca]RKP45201.1 DUF2158 domain-containing protein [Trinickia fusca]